MCAFCASADIIAEISRKVNTRFHFSLSATG